MATAGILIWIQSCFGTCHDSSTLIQTHPCVHIDSPMNDSAQWLFCLMHSMNIFHHAGPQWLQLKGWNIKKLVTYAKNCRDMLRHVEYVETRIFQFSTSFTLPLLSVLLSSQSTPFYSVSLWRLRLQRFAITEAYNLPTASRTPWSTDPTSEAWGPHRRRTMGGLGFQQTWQGHATQRCGVAGGTWQKSWFRDHWGPPCQATKIAGNWYF